MSETQYQLLLLTSRRSYVDALACNKERALSEGQ